MPLSDGEEPHRALFAAAGASGTWDWDILRNRLFVDEAFAELYGLDPREGRAGLPVKAFFSAIHPDDRARMRIAVAGILGGAELFSKEFRIVLPDETSLWVHARGHCQRDDDEQPLHFSGVLVDVTERKRTEERLRIAQSAGGVGTFEYVDGFATVSVSEQFCRLLGLHPTSVLPVRTINSVVVSGSDPIIPEAEQGAASTIEPLHGEFEIVRRDDGAPRWIARRGEIVRDLGTGFRFVGVIYDVTAAKDAEHALRALNDNLESRVLEEIAVRQQAEEALRQAQKMEAVGQLTGGIAHDFNNLLTIIIGNIDTVTRRFGAAADPRIKRSLENALKGAERAAALTQRLLAFSRQQPLAPKQIHVGRLIAGMSDLLKRTITEVISTEIVSDPDLWSVNVDPNQLENAILNLVVNARDAMVDGGALRVEAENALLGGAEAGRLQLTAGHYVVVSVTDTGSGMSPATLARACDPFFTTKDVGKGTGLGLSMVYGFIQQTGGQVDIASTLGEGTRICLYLPAHLDAAGEEPVILDEFAAMGSATETILVVEDDDDVRAYTVEMLRELGYRVVEAHDPLSALRLLERQDEPIKLLFTDVVMPGMSGRELVEAARALQPDLRVLYASGYPRDAITQAGRLDEGVELLSKPFTFLSLSQRVRELIERP
ncbi:PAS domain S-box-containing protein [Sphingomonas sp. YR710]|jgi:PAS domain S-box-containing protein|uniref:hybrid sensor histidine kinase/response regulator n=1 Tax=Sphingomonas sp. YR710 TaxID=1882773 RepID=UPI000884F1AC|nr:hybrid sensor histidine kinase/response regulator [Sphingomonas sp. YR710]SDC29127.1 PAS domain S-box-containing protein [Sphingomonas sp. YR710]